jgi:hypothetical protein
VSARAIVKTIRRKVQGGVDGIQNRIVAARDEGLLVKVGLPKGSGTHGPSGMPVVELGAIHEFGSGDNRIPERPFLRGTIKAKRREHNELIRRLGRAVMTGRESPQIALTKLGMRAAADVQEQIADGVPPPNAPSTIRKKGSSTPLIDTGALRQAITHQVFKGKK